MYVFFFNVALDERLKKNMARVVKKVADPPDLGEREKRNIYIH